MNGKHDHTTAVCVSLRWSGDLRVVRVDTSYLTHNWGTRGGRERLIPSSTGPKHLPTAHNTIKVTDSGMNV